MQIRVATPDDAPGMAEVHVRGWQVGYAGIVSDEILARQDVAQRQAAWLRILNDKVPYPPMVADEDSRIIGIVGFAAASMGVSGHSTEGLPADLGEVTVLYVEPDCWNKGVGSALLSAAETALKEAGFASAMLWTPRDAARTRRFYESRGWRADGATEHSRFIGTQIVRYRKALLP